jgi:PadR family transcriptional regulator PadR
MTGQALKGHLDLLVLSVLTDRPLHGYAVIEALRDCSGEAFDLPEGTVYPALHRLERAGLLTSEWCVVGGRRRRTYRITESGATSLADMRSAWLEFSTAVTRVLGGPTWTTT